MSISHLAKAVKASPTLALNAEAQRLKEAGEPIIHLGSGEPKSKVPIDAILACAAKLNTADIRYTPTKGIPSLVKAIIKYTEQNYEKTVGTEHVCVHAGAKQAFYNLMMTLLDPKDEAIILAPYWVSYPEIVRMVHGVPVIVKAADGGFVPSLSEIKNAVTPRTKVIIVNSPNNPSGALFPDDHIGELVSFCESKNIYLIMDDIYHKLVFDGKQAASVYRFAKNQTESSTMIVVNGVSKAYAMTGFRIGWTVANKEVTAAMVNVAAQNTSCPSVVLQAAAVGALDGVQSGIETLRQTLENSRNVMLKELAAFTGVKTVKPGGTFYCLPDFSAYEPDSTKLCKMLLDKARVVTVPGVEFGMEGHLRLSYCGSMKEITEGVKRIKWALDPNSPAEMYIGDRCCRRDWK
jgi:aspartate aminotransferase